MVGWEAPALVLGLFMGINRWADRKLSEKKRKEEKQRDADRRYHCLAEGVMPDLHGFYYEMDQVIESFQGRAQVDNFCKNMDKMIEFMCHCREPGGVPTVQNLMTMAMSARNCEQPPDEVFSKVMGDRLLGEIKRTSTSKAPAGPALEASAKIMQLMFPQQRQNLAQVYKLRKFGG